jgi:hypothetical protein
MIKINKNKNTQQEPKKKRFTLFKKETAILKDLGSFATLC